MDPGARGEFAHRGARSVAIQLVPVDAIVRLWRAGETLDAVANEYGLTRDTAEAICRVAA